MRCPACQHENSQAAKFCEECGTRLIRACSRCGQEVSPRAKFCPECGQSLAEAPPAGRFGSAQAYTPKHLAEKILQSKSALEGERKQVTVLFCDIVESSRLAERLDPEEMHQLMDRALRLMAEAVHRYEGTVNQFLGDGIMALFGAPVALEDHAFRAVQAAQAIRETLSGYSEQLKQERGVELHLRLGLNTGLVVVGRIGDDLRMDYSAVGNTTHLAARMQALAEPGTILITEAMHRLVEGYIKSEALGPVQVKGQSEPVSVYKVTGRRRWRSRLEVSAERGLTPLVGRRRELDVLHDCLARVKAGRGQVVGIVGEPGVGKSRLLYEFRKSLEGEQVTWLEGHCVAYGQATPYLPILEILRTNFQLEEGDNPLQIQEKLRQGLRSLDPALEGILPFLGELFTLPGEDDPLQHMDPKDKRQKTFEAIRALTVAGSQRRPHVVIFEDLHWIDKTSEDYLVFLIESLAGVPLMLLTTHRPGYSVRWADKPYYTQIALDLLTEREAEAMVATLLGTHDLPPELLRLAREKAEGNPLFVEEITTSLLERGILVRRNGGISWAGAAVVEFPATIHDIIRARIDRLEEPVKRTVQTAAVIGREFGLRLLTRISEMATEVQHYLDTLKHLEFIHETRFFPELEYIFKHAVIQDVAYQSLLVHRRKELHGAIGRAIEDLYADRLEEQAAILTYHYARSERQDKAITYTLLAGDRAARLYANAEATTYYTQALTIARALPASPERQRAQIDATLKLAAVGITRQDIERDRLNLEQARALAEALQDELRLARVLYWFGRMHYVRGDPQAAIAYARQSLEIADRLEDDTLAAPPVNLMGRIYWQLSDFAQASQMLERSVEQMRRLGNKSEEATAAGFAGMAFGQMGEFDRALSYADYGIQLAQEIQNPFAEAAAYNYRGTIRGEQRGEWARAIADYQEARHIAERAGDLFRVLMVKFLEGQAHTMAGDPARGRVLLEESLALTEQIGTRFALAWQKTYLAACLLALGELEAVPPLCHEAIRLAEETGDKVRNALAHRTLAEAFFYLEPSDLEQAEHAILNAIRILQEIGVKPDLARSYVSYARLLKAKGEEEKANEHLAQAIGMFREMGMAWDLARAEQVLRES
ncbi:MAG: AAA family ATPase [candidate division NC10 bacterium]|nr:AAA family ATPase [candidate division NC10 bacterium]